MGDKPGSRGTTGDVRRLRHPLSGATYEWADDGVGPIHVRRKDGSAARFDRDGNWVEGDRFTADPELCRWIFSGGGAGRAEEATTR